MYIYKGELFAIAVIAGFLWAVIPWAPLNAGEGIMAGIYLVLFSAGTVAAIEQAIEAVTGREFLGGKKWRKDEK